ncbi:MAG: hypothetical protein ABFS14_10175 [Gemmatimonadota bacterium]
MPDKQWQLDALVSGAGVRRSVPVRMSDGSLLVDDMAVPIGSVYWVARRATMLLVFAGESSLALKGAPRDLDALWRELDSVVDQTEVRRNLVRRLGHEVVLFSAAAAVLGTLDGQAVRGLFVVTATRHGFHMFAGETHQTLAWPVDTVQPIPGPDDRPEASARLIKGADELTIRYLYPEEVSALVDVAQAEPPAKPRSESLEMFTRSEVAPPATADLPEFSLAAGSLAEVAARAAANIPGETAAHAGIEPPFFETLFLELGEIALGPLLLRKSAAKSATNLAKAVRALDAEGLKTDSEAAISAVVDRILTVFGIELARVRRDQGQKVGRDTSQVANDRLALETILQEPFVRLWSRFEGLAEQQDGLLESVAELDVAHPDSSEDEVRAAADEWRASLARLDSGYEGAWREMVEEIENMWSTVLLPRLVAARTPGLSRSANWIQIAVLAVITVALVATLVVFAAT